MSNELNKVIYRISSMHCKSCEILIEEKLLEIKNIEKVKADHNKNIVEIFYNGENLNKNEIQKELEKLNYKIIESPQENISNNLNFSKISELIIAIISFATLYMLFKLLKIDNIFNVDISSNTISFGTILLIGLAAGLSTCMALVGGLVLSISTKFNEQNPNLKPQEKIKPHIFFNIGRVIGFGLLGGILGLIGSTFKISLGFTGFLTIIVGIIMIFMGIQLLNILPKKFHFKLTLPKILQKILKIKQTKEKEYSNARSMLLGALTFFLPCGFTQAMQLYAVTSGDFKTGFLVMSLFAIGTIPGLLGIGTLISFIKGKFSGIFFKLVGLIVISFAIFNIINGYNLSGIRNVLNNINTKPQGIDKVVSENYNKEQVLQAIYTNQLDINPNEFTVNINQKVKLEIDVKETASGCMSTIMIPGIYNIPEYLKQGKIVLEFTPTQKGKFPITCAMGVGRGYLIVK